LIVADTPKWNIQYTSKLSMNDTTKKITYTFTADKAKVKPNDTTKKTIYTFTVNKPKVKPIDVTLIPPPNYTDFTGKLILINGKEVTEDEMKKLSVANIESVIPYSGSDDTGTEGSYIKKYGEKAKNGVIWITLKKLKND
jgi:hypothetical protein